MKIFFTGEYIKIMVIEKNYRLSGAVAFPPPAHFGI
jgi:hypothetical protein